MNPRGVSHSRWAAVGKADGADSPVVRRERRRAASRSNGRFTGRLRRGQGGTSPVYGTRSIRARHASPTRGSPSPGAGTGVLEGGGSSSKDAPHAAGPPHCPALLSGPGMPSFLRSALLAAALIVVPVQLRPGLRLPGADTPGGSDHARAAAVHCLVAEARAEAGRAPLRQTASLVRSAKLKASRIAGVPRVHAHPVRLTDGSLDARRRLRPRPATRWPRTSPGCRAAPRRATSCRPG